MSETVENERAPGEHAHVDPTSLQFRRTLGRFATGVTVMTTVVDGVPHGMTANAVTSVSLEPLLVLVCVDRSAHMASQVVAAGSFALTVLAEDQEDLSNHFADPARQLGAEGFDGVATSTSVTGSPVLTGAVGWLDCVVHELLDGGDHLIVLGRVLALGHQPTAQPLVWFGSGYHRLAED